MKTSLKLSILGFMLAGVVTSAQAWNYTGSGPWASATYGNWTVFEDGWGSQNDQSQTLYANNAGNFACYVNYTGGGTKNYAHTQANVDLPISSSYFCTSSYNWSGPNNPWYTFFYDTWTANMQDELMIEEGWNVVGNPTWGTQIAANVNIGGKQIATVYQANNGANNVLIFSPNNSQTSGSEDIMAYFIWAQNRGLLHNSTLHQLSFGTEVTYTSGWQQFTVNSFSANWGSNGGSINNGTYKLIARNSGKAMDAYGWGTANGTQIDQWTYGGGNNQKWTVTSLGNNVYKIINVNSGKSLDINGWGTANGTKVQLWDYSGGSNQQFAFSATDSGYYRITPQNATGSCLDVNGASTSDGALIQLWNYGGGYNQQWAPQAP